MKVTTLPRAKSTKPYLTPLFLLATFAFSLIFFSQIGQAQQTSLSLADILIGLRSKKVTLPERNKLLTDAVKTRGITFVLTEEIEKELENTGATLELVTAIRQKSPVIKPVSPNPIMTPSPIPVSTPKPAPSAPDFTFYQNRANAYFVKGNYDLAVVDYNKVIELNSKEATAYLSRGLAYYNTKFYDLAIGDYTKAIELSPKESMIYFKRGDSYEKMGNIEKAIADYQKAVEFDAENETAKAYLQRLQAEQAKNAPKPQVIEKPKETASISKPVTEPKAFNLGSLNNLAVRLAVPTYPQAERQRNIFGLVTVQISLDEEGKVISAKALDGPRSLRSFAEDAAQKSKFKPAVTDGKQVKATGFITYNFKLK